MAIEIIVREYGTGAAGNKRFVACARRKHAGVSDKRVFCAFAKGKNGLQLASRAVRGALKKIAAAKIAAVDLSGAKRRKSRKRRRR